MAFHVACPITCRKICFCVPGTPAPLLSPGARDSFLQDVLDLETLLAKPAFLTAGGEETVEVLVPRLAKDLKSKKTKNDGVDDSQLSLSKKAVMRKKATMAAIAVAEAAALAEQAKRAAEASRQLAEAGTTSNGGATGSTCGICFVHEIAGSKRAERMLPCPNCKRMFHRGCIKRYASNRDLFNWSSWVCGFCRICEVCKRTGEPNKLMFCKRCDGALHAYCQQPHLKQVPKGPYLCPKHTICHSCSSRVPGSGVSSRWFLEYTFCDACGRLFMKKKYCTICLKVYRDSEATPMVCCDNCEHWVHTHCDGISDEKYQEFQIDNNLHYKCAACRGDCHKIKDMDDAANEIWRRRDEADKEIIHQMQVAAGVPPKEENLKFCPSDDEDYRTAEAKKTVKAFQSKAKDRDVKASKKTEFGKPKLDLEPSGTGGIIKKFKITLPKAHPDNFRGHTDERDFDSVEDKGPHSADKKKKDSVVKLTKYMMQARESRESIVAGNGKSTMADHNSPVSKTHNKSSFNVLDDKSMVNRMKNDHENVKLSENRKVIDGQVKSVKFVHSMKEKKERETFLPPPTKERDANRMVMKIRTANRAANFEGQIQTDQMYSDGEGSARTGDSLYEGGSSLHSPYVDKPVHTWGNREDVRGQRLPNVKYRDKDSRVSKLARSYEEAYDDEGLDSNDTSSEKESTQKYANGNSLRGQRSKRRKHHALEMQKPNSQEEESLSDVNDDTSDDNWILQKLGREAIGKRVEVYHSRDRSWARGKVTEVFLHRSQFTVSFDDGRLETLDFGSRNVHVLSQLGKHPRS